MSLIYSQGNSKAIEGIADGNCFVYISAAYTVSPSDFGKTIVCAGSSAYTVTIPTVLTSMDGCRWNFIFVPTASVQITLSGSFNGGSTAVYYSCYEAVSVYANKANSTCVLINETLFGCNFGAYMEFNFTLTSGTPATVVYDTRINDSGIETPNGNFYATNTGIWKPLLAGFYYIRYGVLLSSPTAGTILSLQINQSGNAKDIFTTLPSITGDQLICYVDGVYKMDGATDTLKVTATQTGTSSIAVATGIGGCTAFGYRISRWTN